MNAPVLPVRIRLTPSYEAMALARRLPHAQDVLETPQSLVNGGQWVHDLLGRILHRLANGTCIRLAVELYLDWMLGCIPTQAAVEGLHYILYNCRQGGTHDNRYSNRFTP